MKPFFKAFLAFSLIFSVRLAALAASSQDSGVLTQVSGNVTVKNKSGQALASVKNGSKVQEGDRVQTSANSQTTVRFFDGSQLAISQNSNIQMTRIRKLPGQDKVLRFKLLVGKMMATVQKLASSKSSFEVEAGGVVCGVRGTQYSVQYDPTTGKVNVQVLDGTVWVDANGKTFTFGAGQGGSFTNGNPDQGHNEGNGNGNQSKGGNDFNPFYGFDGTPGDDLNGSLTDLPGGMDGVTGQVSDAGHSSGNGQGLILQLGFPEYGPLPAAKK